MSAASSSSQPFSPQQYTPPTGGGPLKTGDMAQIGKLDASSSSFESTRININQGDGSIHAVAVESFSSQPDAIDQNMQNIQVLNAAAKILIGEKLSKTDKPFAKSAKKVAQFYEAQAGIIKQKGEPADKMRGHLAQSLTQLRIGLGKQTSAAQRKMSASASSKETSAWGENRKLPTKEQIGTQFRDIATDKGHASDGQDVHRHLQAGVVSLTDKEDHDVFEQNQVSTADVTSFDNEEDKVEAFAQRIEVTLGSFKDVVTQANPDAGAKINAEITELTDAIRSSPHNAGAERVSEKMDQWRHSGDPPLENLARLAHTLNQNFHMGPISQPILGCLKSDFGITDTPGAMRGLAGSQFKMGSDTKQINVRMTADNRVEVEHKVSIRQTIPQDSTVRIDVTVTLSAKADDLKTWNHSIKTEVHSSRVEDKGTETTIRAIYQDLNIPLAN